MDPLGRGRRRRHRRRLAGGEASVLTARRKLRPSDDVTGKRIPTSRVGRTAAIGRLAAGQGARQLATRTANVARSDDRRRAALEKRHIEAAQQIVTVLGTMKGAAMKIGQVLSVVDAGLVPEEFREEFQAKLAELRDAAPTVSFADMRRVIESELGEKLGAVFADFDETPIAAASIGQVYRATLKGDGRDVAVKVQYPRVAEAVRADLQNLGLILRVARTVAPGLDVRATGDEIRERIHEELDYELEAANQRALSRRYRGHPFIHVPAVVSELSRERVMVSEFVPGAGFEDVKRRDQATRDRVGEILFRFYMGSMYRHGQFSGDPHPGNFLLRDDGTVTFLDFGLFKSLPRTAIEAELQSLRLGAAGDADGLLAHWAHMGLLRKPERFDAEGVLAQFLDATWWYLTDEEVALDGDVATQVLIDMGDPRSEHFGQMRHETLPADHLFGRRVEVLTLAVLGQLRASGNWYRILSEWLDSDAEPATELGRLEAAFWISP